MGHSPSSCKPCNGKAVAVPQPRNASRFVPRRRSSSDTNALNPTLLEAAAPQSKQGICKSSAMPEHELQGQVEANRAGTRPSYHEQTLGMAQKMLSEATPDRGMSTHGPHSSQLTPPAEHGPRRLYSMSHLLPKQDLQQSQQPQGQWQEKEHQEPKALHSHNAPVKPMQQAQQKAGNSSWEYAVACHQHADSYALQQGLRFVAQLPSPTKKRQQDFNPPEQRAIRQSKSRFAELPRTVPLALGVERLDPVMVQQLLRSGGCVLVDVRGDDRTCGTIEGAVHVPAIDAEPFPARVQELVKSWRNQPLIIFHCQYSAHRAPQCAAWYREQATQNQRVAIMDGGFRGWESTGLPVQRGQMPCQAQQTVQVHQDVKYA